MSNITENIKKELIKRCNTYEQETGYNYYTDHIKYVVKNAIEHQIPAINDVISPLPVTGQLDGVRVKLDYDKYHEEIENVIVDGKKLSELAEIKKSFMYDYILVKIYSESSLIQ